MISERMLASNSGFWNYLCPMMENFVRMANTELVVRIGRSGSDATRAERRALVNECGFELLRFFIESEVSSQMFEVSPWASCSALDVALSEIVVRVESRLARLERRTANNGESLSVPERYDAWLIARSIEGALESLGEGSIKFCPTLKGCGYLSSCQGDIIKGGTLVEVKSVTGGFRSEHLRQAIAYLALNYASKQYEIDRLCLVNGRQGTLLPISTRSLSVRISGKDEPQLMDEILFQLANSETSR